MVVLTSNFTIAVIEAEWSLLEVWQVTHYLKSTRRKVEGIHLLEGKHREGKEGQRKSKRERDEEGDSDSKKIEWFYFQVVEFNLK